MNDPRPLIQEEREKLVGWATAIAQHSEGIHRRLFINEAHGILCYEATVVDLKSDLDGLRDELSERTEIDAAAVARALYLETYGP